MWTWQRYYVDVCVFCYVVLVCLERTYDRCSACHILIAPSTVFIERECLSNASTAINITMLHMHMHTNDEICPSAVCTVPWSKQFMDSGMSIVAFIFIEFLFTLSLFLCGVTSNPDPMRLRRVVLNTQCTSHDRSQIISYESPRGGITVITRKEDSTTSNILIQNARPSDSGRYQCEPSNGESKGVLVHVLNGKAFETYISYLC